MNLTKSIKRTEKKEHYVLSPAQKRMYILQQFDPSSIAYNLTEIISGFTGELKKVEDVINEIISQHEILRTTFRTIDGNPVQIIQEDGQIQIDTLCFDDFSMEDISSSLMQPFDLSVFPLIRVSHIIPGGLLSPFLFVEFHHIIFDATSVSLFTKAFNEIYEGRSLPPPKFQYKDYAESFFEMRNQQELEKQRTFWLDKFSDDTPILELPTDFQRLAIKSDRGNAFEFSLDKKTTSSLKALAQGCETTLFTVLLSVFKVFLKRISQQDDLVVGVPVAGRNHHELASAFGMFVNTIPVRSSPSDDLSFINFLNDLKDNVKGCLDNQSIQFDEIVSLTNQVRDNSRSPVFDVVFDMLNHKRYDITANNVIDIDEISADTANIQKPVTAQYDLGLKSIELGDNIIFIFEYCTDLFRRDSIISFIRIFNKILKAVVSNPTQKIGSIKIISEQEKHQLLTEFNATDSIYGKDTIISLFREQVSAVPDNVALTCHGEQVTYQELDEKSDQLAAYLCTEGVKKQDVVALMAERSIEVIIAIVGILKAGVTYLPIDPAQPKSRIEHILNESRAKLLLAQGDQKKEYNSKVRIYDLQDCLQSDTTGVDLIEVKSSDVAYIIYTSGSTGKPKGVMITHESVVNLIQSQKETFGIDEQDRILQFSTLAFDASVEQIWLAFTSGSMLVLINRETLADHVAFDQYVAAQGVTHLHATPSFLELLEFNEPNNIKRIVSGGEECKATLVNKFIKDYEFYNEYGPTETTVTSTISYMEGQSLEQNTNISIGKPVGNTRLYILDKNLELVPQGIKGELYIGGKGLAKGYVKDTELTRSSFVKNPHDSGAEMYKTGDLARWLPDGNVEYLGRIDHQVKIRGFRIELGEIKHQLTSHKQINEVVVLAREKEGNKYLVAYYVSAEEISSDNLRTYLSDKLPDYMIPSYFVQLESMPLTISGKLDERSLPDPQYIRVEDYVAPSSETEKQLVSLWSNVLTFEEDIISVTRSFFEIGGHSLNAIGLANQVHKTFNVDLSLQEIFNKPTIRSMAQFIDAQRWLTEEEVKNSIEKTEITI